MTGYQSKKGMARDKLEQEAFNDWWNNDYDDSTNPYELDTFAYWAWAGWQAALAQPAQEPWPEEPFGHMAGGVQPPQRPWVEPTGNEWFEWWRVSAIADETEAEIDFADFLIIAQAVAAKLKEHNNG